MAEPQGHVQIALNPATGKCPACGEWAVVVIQVTQPLPLLLTAGMNGGTAKPQQAGQQMSRVLHQYLRCLGCDWRQHNLPGEDGKMHPVQRVHEPPKDTAS